jgi:hypothetical protein
MPETSHTLIANDDGLYLRVVSHGREALIRLRAEAPSTAAVSQDGLVANDDGLYVRLTVHGRDELIRLTATAPIAAAVIQETWAALRESSRS